MERLSGEEKRRRRRRESSENREGRKLTKEENQDLGPPEEFVGGLKENSKKEKK